MNLKSILKMSIRVSFYNNIQLVFSDLFSKSPSMLTKSNLTKTNLTKLNQTQSNKTKPNQTKLRSAQKNVTKLNSTKPINSSKLAQIRPNQNQTLLDASFLSLCLSHPLLLSHHFSGTVNYSCQYITIFFLDVG